MFSSLQSNRGARSIWLSLMVLSSLLLLVATVSVAAETSTVDSPMVWLQAPGEPVAAGEEITVAVRISNVTDLYGIQFSLSFEPSALMVVDEDPTLADVQIAPAGCPAADFIIKNRADNVAGRLDYVVTQLSPTPPVNGNCTVAHIRFRTQQATSTQLRFDELILANPNGAPITTDSSDLEIDIVASDQIFLPAVLK
jgi:hypothetical protein